MISPFALASTPPSVARLHPLSRKLGRTREGEHVLSRTTLSTGAFSASALKQAMCHPSGSRKMIIVAQRLRGNMRRGARCRRHQASPPPYALLWIAVLRCVGKAQRSLCATRAAGPGGRSVEVAGELANGSLPATIRGAFREADAIVDHLKPELIVCQSIPDSNGAETLVRKGMLEAVRDELVHDHRHRRGVAEWKLEWPTVHRER